MSEQEVEQVVKNYIKGTYTADIELLKSVFHPEAIMTGYMGADLMITNPTPFIEDIGSHPAMKESGADYNAKITNLKVTGNIAEATVYETGFFGDGTLEDHFHLIKDSNGDWKIISKCFTTIQRTNRTVNEGFISMSKASEARRSERCSSRFSFDREVQQSGME